MSKNISQVLPKGDKEIIRDALIQYQRTLDCLIDKFVREGNGRMVDQLHHTRFDLHSLIGFMDYDVTINMPQKAKDNFCHLHSVDFPVYNQDKCKLEYPVEEESKWVTILSGDFTFIDDGVHGRECHVNELTTIEKYLREDMGGVIDDIENNGGGWIVVEDYDGSIEMNFDKPKEVDDREYQVVWLVHTYEPKTEVVGIDFFNTDNGFWGDDYNAVDKLDIDGRTMVEGSIIVIRIK